MLDCHFDPLVTIEEVLHAPDIEEVENVFSIEYRNTFFVQHFADAENLRIAIRLFKVLLAKADEVVSTSRCIRNTNDHAISEDLEPKFGRDAEKTWFRHLDVCSKSVKKLAPNRRFCDGPGLECQSEVGEGGEEECWSVVLFL